MRTRANWYFNDLKYFDDLFDYLIKELSYLRIYFYRNIPRGDPRRFWIIRINTMLRKIYPTHPVIHIGLHGAYATKKEQEE